MNSSERTPFHLGLSSVLAEIKLENGDVLLHAPPLQVLPLQALQHLLQMRHCCGLVKGRERHARRERR